MTGENNNFEIVLVEKDKEGKYHEKVVGNNFLIVGEARDYLEFYILPRLKGRLEQYDLSYTHDWIWGIKNSIFGLFLTDRKTQCVSSCYLIREYIEEGSI